MTTTSTDEYVARFALRLRTPVRTSVTSEILLRPRTSAGHLREVVLRCVAVNGAIDIVRLELTYAGPVAPISGWGNGSEGMTLITTSGRPGIVFPALEVQPLVAWFLFELSAFTLQSDVYWAMRDAPPVIEEFMWKLPNGEERPGLALPWPEPMLATLRDTGERVATADDFAALQANLAGQTNAGAPLWRIVLASAHRERSNDIRAVVMWCATALDVALQPLMPADRRVGVPLFRGEVGATPDLRTRDATLFDDIAQLWYSRHGIVHRGLVALFNDNPANGGPPIRDLTHRDAERFLRAVPRAVAFIEQNPP